MAHFKDKIECKTENLGVARMVCPQKRNHWSAEEKGVFQLYVGKRWKHSVGYKLVDFVKTDIAFEQKGEMTLMAGDLIVMRLYAGTMVNMLMRL